MAITDTHQDQRENLVEVGRLCYSRRYICGTEGNFSIRLEEDLLLTTAASTCKGRLKPDELVLTDLNGKPIAGQTRRPSTELAMHITAYKQRPDVKAIVHAHPTVAVGFTVAGQSLAKCVLPEVVCTLGTIPVAPYATPSTDEVSQSIAELVTKYDALVMDHHGALALGKDIWDAYYKLETLEHHAETMLVAHLLGGVKPLHKFQVEKLLDIVGVYGLQRLQAQTRFSVQTHAPSMETTNVSEPLHPLEIVTTVYLLRHGHTEETEKGKLYNDPSVELTDRGREQAKALGAWLEKIKPDVLACSTAKRVRSTAEIIENAIGLKAIPIEHLNEWSVGEWEGRTYVDVKEKDPEAYKAWSANPIDHAPPGGESITDLYNRIRGQLKSIIKQNEGKTIAIVSHAGVIRSILVEALGMPLINFWRISIPTGSVSKIDFSDNFATIHFTALQPEQAQNK